MRLRGVRSLTAKDPRRYAAGTGVDVSKTSSICRRLYSLRQRRTESSAAAGNAFDAEEKDAGDQKRKKEHADGDNDEGGRLQTGDKHVVSDDSRLPGDGDGGGAAVAYRRRRCSRP